MRPRQHQERAWDFHADTKGPVHVWPRDDVTEHDLLGLSCVCGPDVEWSDPETGESYDQPFVRHHSLDGREVSSGT